MNKLTLLGRLTRDPELRFTQTNTAVCSFGLAVNKKFKRDGEPDADFFNIICFGKNGEFASKWFEKGMQIALCGSVQLNTWETKDGEKRSSIEVLASDLYFASDKKKKEQEQEVKPQYDGVDFEEMADDGEIPF